MKRNHIALVFVLTTLALTPGCKKKAQEGKEEQKALLTEVGAVSVPENVVAFGGLKSFQDFVSSLVQMAEKFQPEVGPMVSAQVPALLQGQVLGLRSLGWLDQKRPCRFVVLDYKQFERPIVLMLPLSGGKEALLQALPENKAETEGGYKYSNVTGDNVFVYVLKDHAVFTFDPHAFEKVKDFLQGDFAQVPFNEFLDLHFSLKNFRRLAEGDLQAFKEEVAKSREDTGYDVPSLRSVLVAETDLLLSLLQQVEALRVVIAPGANDLEVRASALVLDGSDLQKFVAGTKERKASLHKLLPSGGWFVGSENVDPKVFEGWRKLAYEFWKSLLELDEAGQKRLEEIFEGIMALQTGESAVYVGSEGDFPFAFLAVSGVTEGEKAHKLTQDLVAFVIPRFGNLMKRFEKAAPKEVLQLDFSSPEALVAGLKPLLAEMGVVLKTSTKEAANLKIASVELSVDYQKLPPEMKASEDAEKLEKVLGERFSVAIAYDKSHTYLSFGRDASQIIERAAKGEGGQGSPIDTLVTKAPFRVAGAFYLSLAKVLRILAPLDPEMAQDLPGLASFPGDAAVTLLVGGHGEKVLDAVLSLPIGDLAAIVGKKGSTQGPTP